MRHKDNTIMEFATSAIQRQFWFIQEMNPKSSAYNIVVSLDINGALDSAMLEKAFYVVIERHDILRSAFFERDGQVYQRVMEPCGFEVVHKQVEASGEIEGMLLDTFLEKEVKRPFDLHKGPLFRAFLIKVSENKSILLMVIHHIVIDLRSYHILLEQISKTYNTLLSNNSVASDFGAIQYSTYVEWQQKWLASDNIGPMVHNWKEHLDGQSGTLNLPFDFARRENRLNAGGAFPFRFEASTTEALHRFAKEYRTDTYLVLLAAYLVVLQKHTRQYDITVGTPLSNRRREQHKDIVGCFMNVTPIAFQLAKEDTFEDVLNKVRFNLLFAHRNQEAPLSNILDAVQPNQVSGMNPIYQVGFTVVPIEGLSLQGATVEMRKLHNGGAQLDLFLSFWDIKENIEGYLEFDAQLFDEQTIRGFCQRYEHAVQELISSSSQPIRDLDVLLLEEKQRLVHDVNCTTAEFPNQCVHQLVEQQVDKTPARIAIECGDEKVTYAMLNERANRLAEHLIASGMPPQSMVGIHLSRSIDMVVAVLAVLKSGGVYIPLDPAFPVNRLQYILNTIDLKYMLTTTQLHTPIDCAGLKKINIDVLAGELANCSGQNVPSTQSPQANAYILFTSGSTGKPKGITIHHQAVVNFLLSMKKVPGISADDVLLAITTLSFDISVLELFLPLITGAKIVLAKQNQVTDGQQLLNLIESRRVTYLQATPSTWQMLYATGLNQKRTLKVLCGGEAMTAKLSEQLCEISDDVWNMFGPTETTVWSTCARVQPGEPISIGRPIDNTQIFVVNDDMQLTPPGVAGELLIGGLGVGRGYVNRPDLNKEKFISNSFSGIAGNSVYRTGDLAKYRKDGSLEHLGRTDFQVKLRGFRIELSEIENVLSKYPGITQSVVTLYERNETDKRLIAYVTTTSSQIDASDVRAFLRKELPDYMLPALIETIDEIPLTANGKIARNRLPVPKFDVIGEHKNRVLPKDDVERKIYEIWCSTLGNSDFCAQDRFFDIGGNSLLAIDVTSKVSAAFSQTLSIIEFFENPTVHELAQLIGTSKKNVSMGQVVNRVQNRQAALASRKRRMGRGKKIETYSST